MKTTTLDPKIENDVYNDVKEEAQIILLNDPVNNFDWVIECLCKYCKHTVEQSHQIALITHNNGRCEAKRGDYMKLKPIHEALLDAGLLAEIE